MDQETLIERVRQYEHIYNKKHKEYKNNRAKDNAWNSIAQMMRCPREDVETAWNSLRNRYVTEKRKLRCKPSGSEGSRWRFFEAMSFLDEHVAVRKYRGISCGNKEKVDKSYEVWSADLTAGSSQNSNAVYSASTPHGEETEAEDEERKLLFVEGQRQLIQQPSQHHNESKFENETPKKRKYTGELEKTNTSLGPIEIILAGPEEPENEDGLFARSLTHSLKMIRNRKNKTKAKIEILSVLEKYAEEN